MAIVGPNYEFVFVDVGKPGRDSDGGVFKDTDFYRNLDDPRNLLNIPDDTYLPNFHEKLPYVLIGDDAFALSGRMMKPFPPKNLTLAQRLFNYRHCRARRISENAFGILSQRFRVFLTTMNTLHPSELYPGSTNRFNSEQNICTHQVSQTASLRCCYCNVKKSHHFNIIPLRNKCFICTTSSCSFSLFCKFFPIITS